MPITAWLLTLDSAQAPGTLSLRGDRRFLVSEPVGAWLPVMADCPDDSESLQAELRALPGVTDVALVHAHFADVEVGHGFDLGRRPRTPQSEKTP